VPSVSGQATGQEALPSGRAFFVAGVLLWAVLGVRPDAFAQASIKGCEMKEEESVALGEEFGIAVGPVDEEIQKQLKLQRPEGVVVFEVIGGTPADLAGIKVGGVVKEIDKIDIKTMSDFGCALQRAMKTENFTVGTYETADPGDPVGWGVNFHFVRILKD
jgi:membrane-associated protease RseP (regulator of RpoE activity)